MSRVEKCAIKYAELFGGKPVQNEGNDPEFMRALQRFIFGEVCYTGSLDNKMRELITVTVLAVNQTLPQLKAHTKAALHVGCTPIEIREAIYQCAPVIGFPKTLNAISAMDEVFVSADIALPLENQESVDEENRREMGKHCQDQLLGEIALDCSWLPDPFSAAYPQLLTNFCFADYLTRSGMDISTRLLLILAALTAQGSCAQELHQCTHMALKCGISGEEIVCAVVHAMPYCGVPRAKEALETIRAILN